MKISEGAGLPIVAGKTGSDEVDSHDASVGAATEGTDEELLLRLQAGEMDVVTILFNRYSRMMLGIARRVLQDPAEAEDLVQDVFLFILAKSKLFDASKGTARSWIMQVTYHRAYDRRRYLNARSFYDRTELTDQSGLPPRSGDNVEEFLAWRACLRPAFEQLQAEYRQALMLYFYQGYTIREISQVMNQSEGNVQHYLYRGLQKLRSHVFHRKGSERK